MEGKACNQNWGPYLEELAYLREEFQWACDTREVSFIMASDLASELDKIGRSQPQVVI